MAANDPSRKIGFIQEWSLDRARMNGETYARYPLFSWTLVGSVFLLSTASPVRACEPVLPLIQVVVGPAAITQSLLMLCIAILLKCLIYAVLQKNVRFGRSLLFMLVGNGLSSIVGVISAALIASWVWLIGVPIVWGLCLLPAKRMLAAAPYPWLTRFSPSAVAALMVFALVGSCLLFAFGQGAISAEAWTLYWVFKFLGIYLALMVSILLSAFWEEWVIWKLSSRPATDPSFVAPVIRANLFVLLCLMVFAAGVMLPKRFKSPHFLAASNTTEGKARNISIQRNSALSGAPRQDLRE